MGSEEQLRRTLVDFAKRLHQNGWVANHDGNVSVRLSADRFLATPTAFSKGAITADDLLICDPSGTVVRGKHKIFSEWNLHSAYYTRADVTAVIHAHPPTATGFAVAGARYLEQPILPEAVVSLGPTVPLVPFAAPGPAAAAAVAQYVNACDALLLERHGALTAGRDLEQAYLRMELVEHLAKIAAVSALHGGVRHLGSDVVAPLLAARAKAGLMPPGAQAEPSAKPVVACAPAPHSGTPIQTGREKPVRQQEELLSVVRDEVVRALTELSQTTTKR